MLVRKVGFLQKFCIPAPVVGGLLFALLATILKYFNLLSFSLDTSLQNLFMLTFFTTVGLGASFRLIRLGGKLLMIYWVACGFLALAKTSLVSPCPTYLATPVDRYDGWCCLDEGGHGGATAYGET